MDADSTGTHALGLRFPVQYVIRPRTAEYPDYRGYAGQSRPVRSSPGDEIVVLPSGRRTTVERIDTADGELAVAQRPQRDADPGRRRRRLAWRHHRLGADAPEPIDDFDATVCWLADKASASRRAPAAQARHQHHAGHRRHARGAVRRAALTSEPSPESLELNDIGGSRCGWPSRSGRRLRSEPAHRSLPADRPRRRQHPRRRPGRRRAGFGRGRYRV